jgi:hypothetical protein
MTTYKNVGIHLSSSEIEALRFALVVERDRVYTHADIDTLISGESVREDITTLATHPGI